MSLEKVATNPAPLRGSHLVEWRPTGLQGTTKSAAGSARRYSHHNTQRVLPSRACLHFPFRVLFLSVRAVRPSAHPLDSYACVSCARTLMILCVGQCSRRAVTATHCPPSAAPPQEGERDGRRHSYLVGDRATTSPSLANVIRPLVARNTFRAKSYGSQSWHDRWRRGKSFDFLFLCSQHGRRLRKARRASAREPRGALAGGRPGRGERVRL